MQVTSDLTIRTLRVALWNSYSGNSWDVSAISVGKVFLYLGPHLPLSPLKAI